MRRGRKGATAPLSSSVAIPWVRQYTRTVSTDRQLRISEIFESIQGEGATAGERCVFLRLATCNLRCSFCDTKYTWDWSSHRYEDEVRHAEIPDVARELRGRGEGHLVITGGEPLLQERALSALLESLGPDWFVEVETNGTVSPGAALTARVNQWNVSPKLGNSGEPIERRLVPEALVALRDTGRAWLKWVVASEEDAAEAAAFTARLGFPPSRTLLMPLGATRVQLSANKERTSDLAAKYGFGVSPRLHVDQWDGRRGI